MNEDEFEHDGKTYIAVKDEIQVAIDINCYQCVFEDRDCGFTRPGCTALSRKDGMYVHFEEKQ